MGQNLVEIVVGKNDTIQTSTLWFIYIIVPVLITLIIVAIWVIIKKRKGENG